MVARSRFLYYKNLTVRLITLIKRTGTWYESVVYYVAFIRARHVLYANSSKCMNTHSTARGLTKRSCLNDMVLTYEIGTILEVVFTYSGRIVNTKLTYNTLCCTLSWWCYIRVNSFSRIYGPNITRKHKWINTFICGKYLFIFDFEYNINY